MMQSNVVLVSSTVKFEYISGFFLTFIFSTLNIKLVDEIKKTLANIIFTVF